MASQCGSPRCTAERRGFRRELDSWRYKLIHCVGFESILEGLYGPRLLRDLSLFDDCEPEEVTDWSMNENCSFCCIRREKVKDHISSVSAPTTLTSTEESLSQGQSHTEKLECQADKFLNAIFHKKDLPQNCDRNIPLVAQEIMKRMIRQFAIEYISRSNHVHETQTGSTDESVSVPNDPPAKQTQNFHQEQEGPLDLTVNKNQQKNFQQADGVLDLSTKKNSINSTISTGSSPVSTTIKLSGYKMETDAGTVSNFTEKTGHINHKITALNEILSTLCPNHRKLLTTMLKCLIQEKDASNVQYRGQRISQFQNFSPDFNENKVSEGLCNCNGFKRCESCTVQTVQQVPFPWVPRCMKDLHCLSCKKGTLGCFTIISNGVCKLCNKSNIYQIYTGSYKHFSGCIYAEGATIQACNELPVEEFCNIETTESSALANNIKDYSRPRSPSPPPLSPVRTDGFVIDAISKTTSTLDANSIELIITQPPSLSPEEEEDCGPGVSSQAQTKSKFAEKIEQGGDEFEVIDGEINRSPESENDLEKGESSASFQEVMERINEKLKTIETTDDGQILANLSNNDSYQGNNGSFKLREITTTLLHKAKVSDYSLMELLKQHEKKRENRIIQTRFRKRQETLIALHNSPDSPLSRRQTVQIKRELANLDQLFLSKESTSEKFGKKSAKSSIRDASSSDIEYSLISENTYPSSFPDRYEAECMHLTEECVPGETGDVTECLNSSKESSDSDLLNILEVDEMCVETPRDNIEKSAADHGCKETPVALENSEKVGCRSNIGRTKRNILPPERFSIYITEPRKMFYAACFSENLQRRPIKAKKSDVDCDSSACKISNADSPKEQGLHNDRDHVMVYEMTKSLEVSASGQPELLKGINSIDSSIGNEKDGNAPNLPGVILRASQEPNELMDQCNNKKQKAPIVLNAEPLETVCSMEHSGTAQPDICIDICTKDNSKFVGKCGTLENAVNNLLSSPPECGSTNIFDPNSLLESDCLSADSPLQQRCLHHAICECSVHENTGSTNKTGTSQNCPVNYSSPIKLMFLSKISSEKGVKYTLTSVNSSKLDTNPCILKIGPENMPPKAPEDDNSSASESGDTVENFQNPPAAESGNTTECLQSCSESSSACEEINCNLEMETFGCNSSLCASNNYVRNDAEVEITDQIVEMTVTSKEMDTSILKRKPGRPKKLGPPVEKQIKRPKGRPPKPKVELSEHVECAAEAPDIEKLNTSYPFFTDDSRNIRITVVYGRSRRFKRFVSENNKIVANNHPTNANESDFKQTCGKQVEEIVQGSAVEFDGRPDNSASSLIRSESGYDLVRPIKDKTVSLHTSGNAICPNSKPTAVKTCKGGQRKPGRPAKVKISGISVTVDAVSPQERKVCINSVLPPLDQESSPSNKLFADAPIRDSNSYKESLRIQNDCETSSKESVGEKKVKSAIPLRHSVRLRKPSLYFLHSFANSCSFSQSSALVRKSRKLLLNKAGNELAKSRKLGIKMPSENISSNIISGRNEETKDEVAEFDCGLEMSADPIFISSTSLKWWHTSTSKQTLQQELDTRFEQINSGWLPVDAAELISSDKRKYPVQLERVTKSVMVADDKQVKISPIQMLFQGNCNMDKICAWFMQTTETHSLSIVRKENARDPIEVLNAKGLLAAGNQVDTFPSPQAEQLKKHLKKFALESPVRPRGHFHLSNRMSKFKVFKAKRKLLVGYNKRICCKQHSSHGNLSHHPSVQYKQWKSVWKCVNGNPQYQSLKQDSVNTAESKNSQKTELEINSFPPEREPVLLPSGKENENQDKLIPLNSIGVGLSDCAAIQNSTNNSKCKRTEKLASTAKHSEQEEPFVEGQKKNTFRNANWKLGNFKECRVFLRKINSLDQSHFRNYDAWQQSRNSPPDIKGTSNLQRYTEENSDPCSEINAPAVNAFETQSLNSAGPTLCELKGKRKHKERTSNENGLSSSPSKKVKHFASKQSMPCQVDSDHFTSLSSNSNPVNEKSPQKENAEIVKNNAGKRKRHPGVSTAATSVKRMRRSSEQRLQYNQLQFQIGNSS
ncbi:uncharacterized protein lcorl isoform X1 [Carcharodon carcharias]|uniref:uncharacterized protein lcorl isoform X1 n=2 Tax=Carcharodon carcharias TaxID=13397 RepID=UPI001B7F2CA6|nr:uncharacterized protein lcorl isoform X1 [Carcharodon carcharias]